MIDPVDNLKIAMTIYENKSMNKEAWIRTAVSRCYYSSLLAVKPLLRLGESNIDGDNLHSVAITRVRAADQILGDRLNMLYEMRLEADLADDVAWDRDVIPYAHAIAKAINNRIKSTLRASGPSLQ